MTAPTIYYSDDAGAPVLTNGQDAFYQVVKACLIDGYGSKAAAGWSVVYDDWAASGHASFTNAGQSGVLGLVRATTTDYPPFMYVAEAMIDAQTAVNARSGERAIADITTDFVEGSSEVTQRPVNYRTHYPYWCVVANENFAWVWMSNSDTLFTTAISYSVVSAVGFGAIKNYRGLGSISTPILGNFVICGGCNTERVASTNVSFFHYSTLYGNFSGTVFYGDDGQILSGGGSYCYYPFFYSLSDGNSAGIGEQDTAIVELPIYAASIWLLIDGQTSTRYGKQIGSLTAIYANQMSAWHDDWLDRVLIGNDLKSSFDVAGKTYLKVRISYNFMLLSLDASDWA